MVVGDRGASKRRSAAFAGSAAALAITDSVSGNEQSRIFEQVTSVLTSLAEQKPLILILDDLHWVDDSSASLLFHLARIGPRRWLWVAETHVTRWSKSYPS